MTIKGRISLALLELELRGFNYRYCNLKRAYLSLQGHNLDEETQCFDLNYRNLLVTIYEVDNKLQVLGLIIEYDIEGNVIYD